jgi:SNF2 family DNA or RNA helicase
LLSSSDTLLGISIPPQVDSEGRPLATDDTVPVDQNPLAPLASLLAAPVVLEKMTPFVGEWVLRPYQQEARSALFETNFLLLADDPGTGKVVTAASSIASLIQTERAKRALIVCSEHRRRHWETQLGTWAPGVIVNSVRNFEGHTSAVWSDPGQAILVGYKQLAEDIEQGFIDKSKFEFDVVVLADAWEVLEQADIRLESLKKVRAKWRWGLSGGFPQTPQDWVRLFKYIFPESKDQEVTSHLSDPSERYLPFAMRRTKADIAQEMPAWTRQEQWLDLSDEMLEAYSTALTEERDRLRRKGSSATWKDIDDTLRRLSNAMHTLDDSWEGPKVRALIDLVNEISRAAGKVVVFCHDQHGEMDPLEKALETFGLVRLNANTQTSDLDQILEAMRNDPSIHVLLAHAEATTDGQPITGASYIVHFDYALNAESSRKAEWIVFPDENPSMPVNVIELWLAHTHEEQLHALLMSRLPSEAMDPNERPRPEWYRPLTLDDWLTAVLQIGSHKEKALADS